MEKGFTITYEYGDNLYVNPTNRCNFNCEFCLRHNQGSGGSSLIVFRDGRSLDISGLEGHTPTYPASDGDMMSMKYLFEPGKALAKSGAFNAICNTPSRFVKAGEHTHLYLSESEPAGDDGCK